MAGGSDGLWRGYGTKAKSIYSLFIKADGKECKCLWCGDVQKGKLQRAVGHFRAKHLGHEGDHGTDCSFNASNTNRLSLATNRPSPVANSQSLIILSLASPVTFNLNNHRYRYVSSASNALFYFRCCSLVITMLTIIYIHFCKTVHGSK